ncbi:MAG: hypothetical protein HC794_00170 [Nitrospiraceae bacterium]|nr:hypothetical protein [Nitrospiraceae bacterium]
MNGKTPNEDYVFNAYGSLEEALDALRGIASGWKTGNVAGYRPIEGGQNCPGLKLLFQSLLLFLRFNNTALIHQTAIRAAASEIAKSQEISVEKIAAVGTPGAGQEKPKILDIILRSLIAENSAVMRQVKDHEQAFFNVAVLLANRHLAGQETKGAPEHVDLSKIKKGPADTAELALCEDLWSAAKTFDRLDVKGIHARFAELLGLSADGPRAALIFQAYIPKVAPPSDFSRRKHVISPGFEAYLAGGVHVNRKNENRLSDMAQTILDHLGRRAGQRDPVALLVGEEDAGKSGVVVEVLRKCDHDNQAEAAYDLELELDQTNTKKQRTKLPVFEIDIQDFSNRDVTLRVLAFLKRLEGFDKKRHGGIPPYTDFLEKVKDDYASTWKIRATEDLRDEIKDLSAKFPAFFIFSNWDDFSWSTQRSQLRDMANAALIKCITDGNRMSRILVTAVEAPPDQDKPKLGASKHFTLSNPNFSQLRRYCNFEYPAVFAADLETVEQRLGESEMPGSHIILLMAALHLCIPQAGQNEPNLTEQGRVVIAGFSAAVDGGQGEKETITPIVRLICERLQERGTFAIVMAIAASDDGLHPGSLMHIIRNWTGHEAAVNLLDGSGSECEEFLRRNFGAIASGFFIREKEPTEKNSDQFAHDEKDEVGKKLFEMHQTVRKLILSVIAEPANDWATPYRTISREAERRIAQLAHHRSRLWRAQGFSTNLTPRWKDYARDMQVVEGLLASIAPKDLDDHGRNIAMRQKQPLLRHCADAAFATDDSFEPVLALRFAALAVLRDCLDWNYRMSMVFDQDRTRARLYYLIWALPGKKHFWRLDMLGETEDLKLPDKLPDYAQSCFTVSEQLELLESLALASFHSMQDKLAEWARARAEELVAATHAVPGVQESYVDPENLARIQCAAFDAAVLKGRPAQEADGEKGHKATLLQIRNTLAGKQFKSCEAAFGAEDESGGASAYPNDRDILAAWLHLKSREAYVTGLVQGLKDAWPVYRRIHQAECLLANRIGSTLPTVMVGRPARLFMELPIRSYPGRHHPEYGPDWPSREIRAFMRGIVETNQARLTRFGGGEQVGVLVDMARLAFLSEEFDTAEHYAKEAKVIADQGQVSLGLRMSAMLMDVLIRIEMAEFSSVELEADLRALVVAGNEAEIISKVSQDRRWLPMGAIAKFLQIRVNFFTSKKKKHPRSCCQFV